MEDNEKKKSGWGGRRPGAGRKPKEHMVGTITLRVPQDVFDVLETQTNRTAFVLEAIRYYIKHKMK